MILYIHLKMNNEKFNLTWDLYSDKIIEIHKDMIKTKDFADVTLVTDDEKCLKAHRIILSACSSVLKNILQIDPHNNKQVIFLSGIQHSEMESILQFMYLGETKIYEEQIKEILEVAKSLKIIGLGKSLENIILDKNIKSESRDDNKNENCLELSFDEKNILESQQETLLKGPAIFLCQECQKIFKQKCILARHIQSEHQGVKFACNHCGYQATYQGNLTKHIQSQHNGLKYVCDQCDNQYTDTNTLRKHIQSVHEGVKYGCQKCNQQFTVQANLKRHMKNVHEGYKFFNCDQCNKKFTAQSNLYRHIKNMH